MTHKPTAKLWAHVPGVVYPGEYKFKDIPGVVYPKPLTDIQRAGLAKIDNRIRDRGPRHPKVAKRTTSGITMGGPESLDLAKRANELINVKGMTLAAAELALGLPRRSTLALHMKHNGFALNPHPHKKEISHEKMAEIVARNSAGISIQQMANENGMHLTTLIKKINAYKDAKGI